MYEIELTVRTSFYGPKAHLEITYFPTHPLKKMQWSNFQNLCQKSYENNYIYA